MYQLTACYGCPSDPNSNAVTTTNCKIDYVTKKQYTYKWSSKYTVAYSGVNKLPVTASQHTMDIGSGTHHLEPAS